MQRTTVAASTNGIINCKVLLNNVSSRHMFYQGVCLCGCSIYHRKVWNVTGMSLCVLGMSAELRADGVAVNALWPKTGNTCRSMQF